ncbi:MAG: hypothetical protein ACREMK_12415 [Gemmatimonadota bacterium]
MGRVVNALEFRTVGLAARAGALRGADGFAARERGADLLSY